MDIREITSIETLIDNQVRKKNVCAYARVSTLKDVAHLSFDTQVQTYTKMIMERSDWNFIGVFADEGKSGTNMSKRTQFQTMIGMAKSGLIDLIITKSISRFSRNVVDTITILQNLKQAKVEVWFENENISSFDPKIEFVISVLSGMAEEEARNVSENVKWNVRKRFSEGKFYIVAKGFLGYKYDEDRNLVIDEDEAAVVRKIYEMYTTGIGVSEIIRHLNSNNIKTTYNKGKWYGNAIYNILKNEKYTGNALLQKTVRPSFKAKLKVKNETLPMYYVENSHPPIVTQEQFNKAQEIRKAQIEKFHHITSEKIDKDMYNQHTKYAGMLKCPYCGKSYIRRKKNTNSEYSRNMMMCPSNKMIKTCPGENISVSILDKAILNQLKYIISNKKDFLNLVYKAVESNPQRLSLLLVKEATEAKILGLQAKKQQLLDPINEFELKVMEEINNELNDSSLELPSINNQLSKTYQPEQVKNTINNILLKQAKSNDFDSLLGELIKSITVINKNNIEFRIKHVECSGLLKTKSLFVNYIVRKIENRLEHYVML